MITDGIEYDCANYIYPILNWDSSPLVASVTLAIRHDRSPTAIKAYSHNFIELMSNSTACEQFVVLMKKSNQFGEVVVGNLKIKALDYDYKLCCSVHINLKNFKFMLCFSMKSIISYRLM